MIVFFKLCARVYHFYIAILHQASSCVIKIISLFSRDRSLNDRDLRKQSEKYKNSMHSSIKLMALVQWQSSEALMSVTRVQFPVKAFWLIGQRTVEISDKIPDELSYCCLMNKSQDNLKTIVWRSVWFGGWDESKTTFQKASTGHLNLRWVFRTYLGWRVQVLAYSSVCN